jgi:hypothetical protein
MQCEELTLPCQVAHYPLQAPQEYQDKFSFIEEPHRRVYHAMVNYLDDNLANFTALLKAKGMWNNTIMVWTNQTYLSFLSSYCARLPDGLAQVLTSDNGGYVKSFEGDCDINTPHGYACFNGEAGASESGTCYQVSHGL